MIKKLFLIALCFVPGFAARAEEVAMAFDLRDSGKIYVVVGVIALIFIGIIIYLISIERKIRKLEKYKTGRE